MPLGLLSPLLSEEVFGFFPEQDSLRLQRAVEQTLNIPVLGRRGGGGRGGLQGVRPGQNSTARTVEQIVDIPVPSCGLPDLPDPGGSSSSAVSRDERGDGIFRTFPKVKKSQRFAASPSPRVPARSSSWTPMPPWEFIPRSQ